MRIEIWHLTHDGAYGWGVFNSWAVALGIAGQVAANTRLDRTQAHNVLERCYQNVEQTIGTVTGWTPQNQYQPQPQFPTGSNR